MLHLHSSECRAAAVAVAMTAVVTGVLYATAPLWVHCRVFVLVGAVIVVALASRWTAGGTRSHFPPPLQCPRDREGGCFAVVTGASSGVGYEVALTLAHLGWNLVITGRHRGRLEGARRSLLRATAAGSGDGRGVVVVAEVLEMSNRGSIDAFCKRVAHFNISLLINNAAELNRHLVRTGGDGGGHGWERMMVANALGPMALTEALLPVLHRTACALRVPSRVVNVASCAHTMCRGDVWGQVQGLRTLGDFTLLNFVYYYGLSKLCVIWYTLDLAQRLERDAVARNGATVSAVCCHPGIVASGLYRDLLPRWLIHALYLPSLLVGKTCREGAEAVLRAALEHRDTMRCGYYLCDGDHGVGTAAPLLTKNAADPLLARRFCAWAMKCFNIEPAVLS